jgi:hypothetical protein
MLYRPSKRSAHGPSKYNQLLMLYINVLHWMVYVFIDEGVFDFLTKIMITLFPVRVLISINQRRPRILITTPSTPFHLNMTAATCVHQVVIEDRSSANRMQTLLLIYIHLVPIRIDLSTVLLVLSSRILVLAHIV